MSIRRHLMSSLAICAVVSVSAPIQVEAREIHKFDIPSQDLGSALRTFAKTSRLQVIFDGNTTRGKRSVSIKSQGSPEAALRELLRGTGLTYQRDGQIFIIRGAANTVLASPVVLATAAQAASGVAPQAPVIDEIIVTAQKKEERIIDVPIAMTALSGDALGDRKIEGGSELLRAVPNVNFSKGNFSMYNFSIRGIGTKAVSASTDPAVAVSFNNTPLIRNRLFEAEFFDLQRVEVLRGPQGTLYGRNATGGVVNMIPALPEAEFKGEVKGEVGSFETKRLSGMLNVPISDTIGVRVAGAMTKRDGFDYNTHTQERVNGRDLWSTRATLAWEPSDRFRANAIWQHFEEDDNRSRTGKNLCTRDPGRTELSGLAIPLALQGRFSQGCLASSIYEDEAFGAPNASGFAYVVASNSFFVLGSDAARRVYYGVKTGDPFSDVVQSRNLREIETSYDPVFRAENDLFQFNMEFEPSDGLKLVSQTAYARDSYYSSQDFNRFISKEVFTDSDGLLDPITRLPIDPVHSSPGGIFTDPQLGPSKRMLAVDISRSKNSQWSQEIRLQSSFDGPLNFNLGANYLHFKSQDDYFVLNNMFTFLAYNPYGRVRGTYPGCPPGTTDRDCVYVDPNPIGSLDELGHNYFLSRNIVDTKSWALFGEAYWNVSDTVKITAGLRFTEDKKVATPIPSQLLLGGSPDNGTSGGFVNSGYPADPDIKQIWSKPTGRLVIDWKPDWAFTDTTLIYGSLSRGYKGGGTNPPRPGLNPRIVQFQPLPPTFKPEYVNAFEVGIKNSFDGGRVTLNATGFYYDYKDYQVSQIVDRISLNENFGATNWGLELEAAWRPSRSFRADANFGYLKTKLKDGAQSIDVMNRTQGNEDWVLLRPWLQVPSNCIAPREHVETILRSPLVGSLGLTALSALCGSTGLGTFTPEFSGSRLYQLFGFTYNPLTDAPNGGRGFFAPLDGNELPNAPRMTFNIGTQYTHFIEGGDWELTVRGDYYRQTKSFARVYNTEYDRIKGWDNLNVSVTLVRPESDLTFEVYVKNVFNKTPITDFYTGSDDSGLPTNIFTNDPRIIGFSVGKRF